MIVFEALGTSTGWYPKLKKVGEKVGLIRMPLPVRFTCCGLLVAASVNVRVPVRVPVWLGVNVTLTTQLPPLAARLVPLHPSLEMLKSPEIEVLDTMTEELLGLLKVTFLAADVVSTSCCVNESVVGLTVNFGVGVAVGVAVRVAVAVGDAVAVVVAVDVAVAVVVAV